MQKMVTFDDYELISQLLIPLYNGWSFSMNINLGGSNMDKNKEPFAKEYIYRSNKYIDKTKLITVKRRFFPYLSINYKDEMGINNKAKITVYDMILFKEMLREVHMLTPNAFKKKSDGTLMRVADRVFNLGLELNGEHQLSFYPVLVGEEKNNMGVMITIDDRYSLPINIKTLRGIMYAVDTVDLFGWSFSIISGYHKLGENQVDFSNVSYDPTLKDEIDFDQLNKVNPKTKPVTEKEKRKSFFDD